MGRERDREREQRRKKRGEGRFLNILWRINESCKGNSKAEKSLENEAEQVRLRLLQVSLITGKVAHFKSLSLSHSLLPHSHAFPCLPLSNCSNISITRRQVPKTN